MVICPDCGKEVKDAKFCSNCGASLNNVVEETADVVEDNAPVEEVSEEVVDVADDSASVEEVAEEVIDVEIKEDDASDESEDKKSKFCSNCGREVGLDTVFCPQCGFKFGEDKAEQQTKFCQNCGEKIDINAEICPYCGVRVANPNFAAVDVEKNVLLSAILSFVFPGLGHLYLGLNRKGVSFIIAYIVSAVLVFLLIGFVLMIIVWIWALIDSIKSTEALNSGEFVEDKLF